MRKTILSLNNINARKFLLNPKSYSTINLPPYFTFEDILKQINIELNGSIAKLNEINRAKKLDKVNHFIYHNKDGRYAWRKFQLLNPYLYVSLVNAITSEESWEYIKNRYNTLALTPNIECVSFPVLSEIRKSQKATQVVHWVEEVEKESIRHALDYEYLFQADINDCYGAIYTHSISWALHGKRIAKTNKDYEKLLGNRIDYHLQAMSNGQTNGIPQGSLLMDFIAELVLIYADFQLSEKINKDKEINSIDYFILRYRDDYRIFVKNPISGDKILKYLSETLAELGMSLNTAKTKRNEDIIQDSIKPDKLISMHQEIEDISKYDQIRKELLFVYFLGKKYPNCGSIDKRLDKLNDLIKDNVVLQKHYREFSSILINIAYDSPRSFPVVMRLISRCISNLEKKTKKVILVKLLRKINLLPNSGILEIWLQRVTLKNNFRNKYHENLCKLADGKNVSIFNNSWIENMNIRNIVDNANLINIKNIEKMDEIIDKKEVALFYY